MAKIHIALVGGQVYPVYLGIMDQNPDGVILVCSPQTKDIAQRIAKAIPQNATTLYWELDPVDAKSIFEKVRQLVEKLDDKDTYTVNITGGTKLWSIAFYDYFKDKDNVTLTYIDQNCYINDLTTFDCVLSDVKLNTDTVLKLNGSNIKSSIPFNEYTDEDIDTLRRIKELFKFSYLDSSQLSVPSTSRDINELECRQGSIRIFRNEVTWNKDKHLVSVSIYNRDGIEKTEDLVSPHAFHLFFYTGWFEFDIARRLAQWKYTREIRMNVVFSYKKNLPKNEIDIIVNIGNRLLFVECKTQISDLTDIDKFRSAVKNYGGIAAKALFVTKAPMKETAREKCHDNGIICFSLGDMKRNNNQPIEKTLFSLLEEELFNINK